MEAASIQRKNLVRSLDPRMKLLLVVVISTATMFPQQVIDDDTASQNDTGFIHLHQLVALIIAVIFFVTAGIAGGIFK